ncbi:MAG TPA: hypothetical protein VG982_03265 [Candidatus Paceibacterota bacterium]|nr:hypothetical protein [Candidatus Paceibacterota bacterium]
MNSNNKIVLSAKRKALILLILFWVAPFLTVSFLVELYTFSRPISLGDVIATLIGAALFFFLSLRKELRNLQRSQIEKRIKKIRNEIHKKREELVVLLNNSFRLSMEGYEKSKKGEYLSQNRYMYIDNQVDEKKQQILLLENQVDLLEKIVLASFMH